MEKKNVDAVAVVREIRNAHYEQTKDMTEAERLRFYQEHGQKAQEELKRLAQRTDTSAA